MELAVVARGHPSLPTPNAFVVFFSLCMFFSGQARTRARRNAPALTSLRHARRTRRRGQTGARVRRLPPSRTLPISSLAKYSRSPHLAPSRLKESGRPSLPRPQRQATRKNQLLVPPSENSSPRCFPEISKVFGAPLPKVLRASRSWKSSCVS